MKPSPYPIIALLLALLATSPVGAEDNPLAKLNWEVGPTEGRIGDTATIVVPEGNVFLGAADTKKFMELNENLAGDDEYLFAPNDLRWFAIFHFNPVGYVKDDETLDAQSLLDAVTEGTEQGNVERRKRGWGTMSILGWKFEPRYDRDIKRLEWAFLAKDDSSGSQITNYNTRVLGRSGVMEVVLVADPKDLDASVTDLKQAIRGYTFVPGQGYAEYRDGDRIAKFGLAALIAGGAAAVATKKGLWAVIAGFFAAAWKFIVAAVVGLLAWLRGRFRSRS